MPQISVIVPVYKIEKYINRCVDSIIDQTITDFELILVDDGSPDNCGKICDEYAAKDKRIIVIHQKNGGLSAARNAGIDIARGRYIYFLDGDDYISNELLSCVLSKMDQGLDLVVFQYKFVTEGDAVIGSSRYKPQSFIIDSEQKRVSFLIQDLMQGELGWNAWSRVYRRSIIDEHNLRFADNNKIFAEDLYFTLCYCVFANKIDVIGDCLYYYVQRTDSIMYEQFSVLNAGRMNELGKEVLSFFQKERVSSSLVKVFPVIYYYIMQNVIERYWWKNGLSLRQLRDELVSDISDFSFYSNQMKKLRWCSKYMIPIHSLFQLNERIAIAEFLSDGNMALFRIKNKINNIVNKNKGADCNAKD